MTKEHQCVGQLEGDRQSSDRIIPGVVQLDAILERLLQRASLEPLEHQERGPLSLLDVEARPESPRYVGVPASPGDALVELDLSEEVLGGACGSVRPRDLYHRAVSTVDARADHAETTIRQRRHIRQLI